MKFLKTVRCFPILVISYLIEFVIIPIRMYAFTQADENEYDYTEKYSSQKQVKVTNNLGRAVVYGEFVYLGGYFGFVSDFNGIANGAAGFIDINSDREVESKQVEATDTFTVGNELFFLPGGSGAAGTFVDAAALNAIKVGIITAEQGAGGAQTAVQFRPFVQRTGSESEIKTVVFKVTATAATALQIPGLKEGDEIVDAHVICTAANVSGTLVVEDGAGNDITDGMICAGDKVVVRAGTIDDAYSTLPATGAKVISVGGTAANTRGIVVISYIPA